MATDLFFVHLFNDFSGSPRVLRDAIDALVPNEGNVYLMTSRHSGFLDGAKAKRVIIFYRRSNSRVLQLLFYLVSQVATSVMLLGYLIKSRLSGRKTTVFVNTMLPFGAGFVGRLAADKVVYYVHESYVNPKALKRFLRFFIDQCANHVIFVSQYLAAEERFERPEQCVIYNGLRADFSPAKELNLEKKHALRMILFAGSLKFYKGIDQFRQLALLMPDFQFVAALNCEQHDLQSYVKLSPPPENLLLQVRPDHLSMLFADCFAVVNLSLPDYCVETFGLSLLEGMAFGSPVIAPAAGGPLEFVSPANGLLVDPKNIKLIEKYIRDLGENFSRWQVMSTNSIITAEKFSSENYRKSIRQYAFVRGLI